MADETTKPSGPKISFTEGESSLLLAIMTNLTTDIQFDAEAIATQLGYKNAGVVRTRWNQVKRNKLTATAEGATPTGITKRSTPAKKATAKSVAKGTDEDAEAGTPKKRGRKPKTETKTAKDDTEEDNHAGGEEGVKQESGEAAADDPAAMEE